MIRMRGTTSELLLVASSGVARRLSGGCTLAVWGELLPRDVLPFTGMGADVWRLPELSTVEQEALLHRYTDLTANIGVESGRDSVWWYTWTSSRDRFHSGILADMELITRFQNACVQGLPDRLVMLCHDPYLAHALREVARRNGVNTLVTIGDRLRWARRRLEMTVRPRIGSVKACGRMFIIKSRGKKIKTSLEQAKRAPERTILVTWIKAKNLLDTAPADDTFFGPLPKYLVSPNHSVAVFGDILDGMPSKQGPSAINSLSPVLTAASFISNWALMRSFVRGSISQPSIRHALKSEHPYLAPLIKRDIQANRDSIVYGLLIESALRRLVKTLRPTHIIHMCENNPWERACALSADSVFPEPEVTGYMHCAVILSHTKILITEKEKPVRPRPSQLICTGPRARDIMVRFGGHAPDEVVGACALRHEYLAAIRPREKLNRPVRNILVVLEGLPTMSHLVRFVYDALDGEESFRTVIRPHPAYRLDRILAGAGLSISDFKTLKISKQAQIMQDFENADVVVYKGSTAAMEAGYLGIPLIHYKHPNILTDDPLFETASLKQVVAATQDLVPAIQRFSSMDDEEYLQQRDSLRNYIDEYLTAPGPEFASVFLSGSSKVATLD